MKSPAEVNRYLLKVTLNQCFCDFGQKCFTKSHLLNMAQSDLKTLTVCLPEWEFAGYLAILKSIGDADMEDNLIEMHSMIEVVL